MSNLQELQLQAKDITILYVEDNDLLREKATKFLKKFFTNIDTANDGQVGLDLFKKHHHSIVLTDIKMPNMDGLTLIQHIKQVNLQTKTIIMSAFDDKETLFKSIELGVFRFLKKPVNITELADILLQAIQEIKHEQNTQMFYANIKNIFDYQSAMVVMLDNDSIVLANDAFLEFFDFESVEECQKNMDNLNAIFLPHDGFLYTHDEVNAMESLKLNAQKLYNVKLKNKQKELKHFILKYQDIPEKENYGVLSFEDVTELNLLKLFDTKQTSSDEQNSNNQAMMDLLGLIQKNSAKIELHNYYNGLSITNDALISEIKDGIITIKTSYMQQKAIQIEQKVLLVSSALPQTLESLQIHEINFEKQTVKLKALHFVKTSPIQRSTIRVVPEEGYTISLFLGENKFFGDVIIEDISLNAIKVKLNALPAGLNKGSEVTIDIVFELDKKPLIINTKAVMFRKSESQHSFSLVFTFEDLNHSSLVKYISKRQMALIREIKGLRNG